MKIVINRKESEVSFVAESQEDREILLAIWESEGISLERLETSPSYALVCKLGTEESNMTKCVYCGKENPDLNPCALCGKPHCGHHHCGKEGEDSEYRGDEPVTEEGWYQ